MKIVNFIRSSFGKTCILGNTIVYFISQELIIVCFNLFLKREIAVLQITQLHAQAKKIKTHKKFLKYRNITSVKREMQCVGIMKQISEIPNAINHHISYTNVTNSVRSKLRTRNKVKIFKGNETNIIS